MYKKTLLSLAVASSVALTGCIGGVESGDDTAAKDPNPQGLTWPLFNPGAGQLPIPSDLNFASDNEATDSINEADGTFSVADSAPPVTTALNQLSGASTVAPPVVSFNGQIDPDSVDSREFALLDPSSPFDAQTNPIVPNPNQNVFLIELEYASGDPVLGLQASEVPTVSLGILLQKAQANDPAAIAEIGARFQQPIYKAEVVTLDGSSAIRINPTKPLNPFKRYLVVVTKEVLDINGDPITQSPTYDYLTQNPLVTAPLRPVQTIINSFWEPTAAGFFANIANTARAESLTVDDVALAYSFTTSNDEKVLSYILNPELYLQDTIRGQARLAGVKGELPNSTDYTDLLDAADEAEAAANVDTAAAMAAAGITNNLPSGTTLPVPQDLGDTATFGAPQDVVLVSALASNFVEFGQVQAYQGTIATPYYLGVPTTRGGTDAEGDVINEESWKADAAIATVASNVLLNGKPALAQSDPTVSTVVNYRFALPDLVEQVDIPVLVLRPNGHTTGDPTIIYQHGITTDRSTALTFGSALANATGAAVIAIDHPLHGVTPFSQQDQAGLAISLVTGGAISETQIATVAPLVLSGQEAALATALEGLEDDEGNSIYDATAAADTAADLVGQVPLILAPDVAGLTLELGGDQAAGVQAQSLVNTVANAGSTVPGLAKTGVERHFDYTADTDQSPTAMTATSGASGSLFINLGNFTNTRDKNRQSILDLVNLRMSLKSIDLDGDPNTTDDLLNGDDVYFVGHSLGTITGIPFVSIVNESASTEDDIVAASMLTPGGGIVRLLENSPSFAPQILGGLKQRGLEQGDSRLELFLNVNQAAVDSADPINFVDNIVASGSPIALHQVNGETVIPNSDDETYEGDNPFVENAFDAPLAGTEPLARLLGATNVNNANETETFGPFTGVPMDPATITRYLAGTHSTPVLPTGGELDERVFAEMVGQTTSIVSSMGSIVVSNINGDVNPPEADDDITEIVEQ
jgi:virulence factor lipase-like protein